VHLEDYPEAQKKLIDEKLNEEMKKAREVVTEGLQLRAKAGVKVRQPLNELKLKNTELIHELNTELINIIKEEVNVKEVSGDEKIINDIELNTEITENLKLEGIAREIIRHIQEMRKEAGYEVDNRIKIRYSGWSEIFEKFKKLIAKETLADDIREGISEEADLHKTFETEGQKLEVSLKKI
jgi:isoleucyl-tRNA synthetase